MKTDAADSKLNPGGSSSHNKSQYYGGNITAQVGFNSQDDNDTLMLNNNINKYLGVDNKSLLTYSQNSESNSLKKIQKQAQLLEVTSNQQSKHSMLPTRESPKPTQQPKKPKKNKKVTFRDKVYKGSQIADVFIVEKIKYPSKYDEQDEGTTSCACSIF
eukprot:403333303